VRSPTTDRVPYALIVQRLMDADLLLLEEGNALLTEIETWNPPTDSAEAHRTHAERFTQALEAIMQSDRLEASARQAALETAHALIRQPIDATAPGHCPANHAISAHHTKENTMSVQLGDTAPDFTQETTQGPINFHEWAGDSWVVLFSHPKDFTPVCTTELGAASKLKPEFDKRNVKIVGLSVDGVANHEGWSKDIEETQGAALNFPLIADADRKVSDLYGMIHPNADNTMTVRSVFIIGPDKKVKLMLTYPASTGRNFNEILRVIDSLQLTANYKVATPADWKQGEDCIIVPAVSNEEASSLFPKGFTQIKPYLRTTPQPNG
jgi:thioredoxin-dependent peroxiredoxin